MLIGPLSIHHSMCLTKYLQTNIVHPAHDQFGPRVLVVIKADSSEFSFAN